jgi:tetratricopeptide (TPR) repeat protein
VGRVFRGQVKTIWHPPSVKLGAPAKRDAGAQAGLADWLLCQGRTEEALASARRAQELDPRAFDGIQVGWILFNARRYDEAIRELRTALTT